MLAGISAKAISDPTSRVGWEDWVAHGWSPGLLGGGGLAVIGAVILFLSARLSRRTNRRVGAALWVGATGVVGFLVFTPLASVNFCVETTTGSRCGTKEWSTFLGLTFEGDPNLLPGLVAGAFAATVAWFFVVLIRRRSSKLV